MKLPLGCAATAAIIGFVAASGCMSHTARLATPAPARAASDLPKAGIAAPAGEEPIEGFDVGGVTGTLEAPALAKVKACFFASDYVGAAKELEVALAATPGDKEATRWHYQLGRLRVLAGDLDGAADAFDEAVRGGGPLTPYAQLGAAQALLRAGKVEGSLARASAIEQDSAAYAPARLLMAEALEQKRDHVAAIEIWQGYLAESHHPAGWTQVALRMSDAILEDHPDAARAETAALLARRVVVEAPTSSSSVSRALDLERRALALVPEPRKMRTVVARGKAGTYLPTDWARALSPDDQLTRAGALADTLNYQDAEKALDAMATTMGARAAKGEVGCRMQVLLGSVLGKLRERPRAADVYETAITRCQDYPDVMVEALYFGGKASASANRCDEAIDRFARVEKDFHEHRYADDARLRGAECALERGDEKRYSDMLTTMPADYPEGDMVTEALFRLALRKMAKKDWSQALPLLESARSFKVKETPSSSGGRVAYFQARALYASGDAAGGKRALAQVIRDYPLSYYMAQAYARLFEISEPEARALLEESLGHEAPGRFVIDDDELFHEGGFVRAIELLRQGETDFARRELTKIGLWKDGASNHALWAVASLYSRAGMPQISHTFPRVRVFDWLSHYPAGRWREPWEIAYPRPFADVVEREAKKNGIPAALAYAVMREESAFDPEAVSPARAYGLMQLIIPTAKKVARDVGISCDENSLARPETNVALGCRFLADLRAKFPDNPHLAISAYNAGPGAPTRWIAARESDDFDLWVEQIPFEETRRYTKKVLASYVAYAFLYERDGLDAALRLPRVVAQ